MDTSLTCETHRKGRHFWTSYQTHGEDSLALPETHILEIPSVQTMLPPEQGRMYL